jgi:hypothetical protein
MPQDNWYSVRTWGSAGSGNGQFNAPYDVAVGTTGTVYVTDTGNHRIQAFTQDGVFLRKWGSSGAGAGFFSFPKGVAAGTNEEIYVADTGNHRIQVFDANGGYLRAWGNSGTGNGQFNSPQGIGLGPDGDVYVADSDNHRIQVFLSNGTFLRKWGTYGSFDGQFSSPRGVAVASDGSVFVVDYANDRIQVFDSGGTFFGKWTTGSGNPPTADAPGGIAIGADGLVYVGSHDWYIVQINVQVFEPNGTLLREWGGCRSPYGLDVSRAGTLYVLNGSDNRIQVYVRGPGYGTLGLATRNSLPLPGVISSKQRAGTTFLDIDYLVEDADNATAAVGALAFRDGGNDLGSILKLNTLVEGTATNLGSNIPTGQRRRLTWDAQADWGVSFGNVEIEVLANDGRGLLDFHFITIPSNGPNPQLTISQFPVTQGQMLSCWYWLIATNDTAVTLTGARVYGVGGAYNGAILADGTGTTVDGRRFLFERMRVREATGAEVQRAREGTTPGSVTRWTPRVTFNHGERPKSVNQYGFDTGDWGTDAWWVVPVE